MGGSLEAYNYNNDTSVWESIFTSYNYINNLSRVTVLFNLTMLAQHGYHKHHNVKSNQLTVTLKFIFCFEWNSNVIN